MKVTVDSAGKEYDPPVTAWTGGSLVVSVESLLAVRVMRGECVLTKGFYINVLATSAAEAASAA